MPGDKPLKKVKGKLHIAGIKDIYGYCNGNTYKWL